MLNELFQLSSIKYQKPLQPEIEWNYVGLERSPSKKGNLEPGEIQELEKVFLLKKNLFRFSKLAKNYESSLINRLNNKILNLTKFGQHIE